MCISRHQHLLLVPTNSEITNQSLPLPYSRSMKLLNPMIPGSDANALSANLPNNCDRAFNLFLIHSLAPPLTFGCLSLVVVPPDLGADALGPPNRASIKTPIAIPTAVNMDTIVIPCSLKGSLFSHQVSQFLYPRTS